MPLGRHFLQGYVTLISAERKYSLSVGIVFLLKIKKLRIFSFLQKNYREIQAKILSHGFKETGFKTISYFLFRSFLF